jgi:polar amino acid transport system substrate-binding protein
MLRLWLVFLPILLAACALPRDPQGTSDRIASTHEIRVGVTDNPPWTDAKSAEPKGIEPDLVRAFAAQSGAHVAWSEGSETQLVQTLKDGQLDLVIGGFDKKTQWGSTAGVTQPFAEDADGKKRVMLAAPGENRFILSLDKFLTAHMRSASGARA